MREETRRPVFGILSLALMLALILVGILITIYRPAVAPIGDDDSLAVVIESAANIIATLLVIAAAALTSIILGGISLIRKEPSWPAAVALCLAISALVIVIIAVLKL